ncbi:MAG TPA: helix-turn-helix domain-containing protein, partial [Thermoplasmata archaeon]
MAYYELDFRLRHECPYSAFSIEYPSAVISHWCNWSRDVLEVAPGNEGADRLEDGLRRLFRALGTKVLRRTRTRSGVQVVLQHCACDRLPPPTLPSIERRNCLELQPMVYAQGWERYRIVAFSERDLQALARDLTRSGEFIVGARRTIAEESLHDTLLVSTSSLLGELTPRQVGALTVALDSGYYDLPRRATAEQIARRQGVPRTSFVDH